MGDVLVSGLINLETTVRVDGFPIDYVPVRFPFFGVRSTVSGVGYNVSKALTILGDRVRFVSIIGHDILGTMVRHALATDGIDDGFVVSGLDQTAQSAILYDPQGRRQINVDLKDIQEQVYPESLFKQALAPCSLAVLCNINFSRPFLSLARRQNKLVATDVHTISELDDPYNQDFMRAAHVLFMSDEALPCAPEMWVKRVLNRYGNEVVVVGLGAQGALLSVKRDGFLERIPAVHTREVVNTIGAGDALFSTFVHFYKEDRDPYAAIQKAVVMASCKIGEAGAADGLLDERALCGLCDELGVG
jgi:acarbose 7IV-phosphotransferase